LGERPGEDAGISRWKTLGEIVSNKDEDSPGTSILKTSWSRQADGRWGICGLKSIDLIPRAGFDNDYFSFEDEMELLTNNPPLNTSDLLSSFGPTSYLLKQSILPVVSWVEGQGFIRCIGTAFLISCTGYVATACHVLRDPDDEGYGKVFRQGNRIAFDKKLKLGVLIPTSPASGMRGHIFFPFVESFYWGDWIESPLLHEKTQFSPLTDVAICKIPEMVEGGAHQPLSLSLNAFTKGEKAIAIGYAEMANVPMDVQTGATNIELELYVSVGRVMNNFPKNHFEKEVRTPGPCFDFDAKIPGKMSGSPIFGGDGTIVRGVVSGSWSGERHAYGAMLSPVMQLPLGNGSSIKEMMLSGNEGIARVQGMGL
jgi:hypothetical protein